MTLHLWERQKRIRPRPTGKGRPAEYRYWDILAATLVAGLMTVRASKVSVAAGVRNLERLLEAERKGVRLGRVRVEPNGRITRARSGGREGLSDGWIWIRDLGRTARQAREQLALPRRVGLAAAKRR